MSFHDSTRPLWSNADLARIMLSCSSGCYIVRVMSHEVLFAAMNLARLTAENKAEVRIMVGDERSNDWTYNHVPWGR